MEDGGKFYGHLAYYMYGQLLNFMAIWYILRPIGRFCGHLIYFPPFWYAVQILQPWP
jgi:hypothetical protein